MYERLLIAGAFFAFGIGTCRFIRYITAKKAGGNLAALPGWRRGAPHIVYFTSPNCRVCKSAQTPALNSLRENFGRDLQVITVNVDEDMETAKCWKILTLPTTFIFDADGGLVHHNIGFADAASLLRQMNKGMVSGLKSADAYVSSEKTI